MGMTNQLYWIAGGKDNIKKSLNRSQYMNQFGKTMNESNFRKTMMQHGNRENFSSFSPHNLVNLNRKP